MEPKVSTFIGIRTWKLLVSNARREKAEQGAVGMLIYKESKSKSERERERGDKAMTNTRIL